MSTQCIDNSFMKTIDKYISPAPTPKNHWWVANGKFVTTFLDHLLSKWTKGGPVW